MSAAMSVKSDNSGSSLSPPVTSSSRLHKANSPHGTLPLRQLVPIKITDRCSCFVIGIQSSVATEETLRSNQFFGQFGTIKSIRFILNANPSQALLRFATESSASRAIAWCNEQTSADSPIRAQHGYQKYCISFIKNKQCVKSGCPHRHKWCGPDDIITVKNKTFKVCEAPLDIFLNTKKKKKVKVMKTMNNMSSNNQIEQLLLVQRQFSILQSQHSQQTESVKMLLMQMKAIQAENTMLKQQLKQSQRAQQQQMAQYYYSPQPIQKVQHPQYLPDNGVNNLINEDLVDDIVDCMFKNDRMNEFVVSESSDSF